MGAWGIGPFENDDALDFLGEVENAEDRLGAMSRPLEHVAFAGGYLEATDISEAVAAAGVIGAAVRPSAAAGEPYLPEWVTALTPADVDNGIAEVARKALRRAMQPEDNELWELWEEGGAGAEFQATLARILSWLGDRDD